MFLRRDKPAGAISRPTKAQTAQKQQTKKTVKPLGGWECDEQQEQQNSKTTQAATKKVPTTNIFGEEEYVEVKYEEKQVPTSTLYSYSELSEMNNLQHQIRLVDEILQPGGIKIKPNEGMLSEFAQAAKTLDKNFIGSLLISRLEEGFPYAVKAKALFTIEYLAKKHEAYREYFQQFLEQIRNQPQPSENATAYNNLLKEVLNFVQNGSQTPAANTINSNLITFQGPDYNEDLPYAKDQGIKILNMKKEEEKKQEKKGDKAITKTFISPGEAKKIKKSNPQAQETTLIDTAKPNTNAVANGTTNTENGSFNIFDLDLSTGAGITKEQPKPAQPIQVPQVPTFYQNTMPIPNMTPQQFRQYQQYQQYQQYMLHQQQQLVQQQSLQKQQTSQGKPITGEELYSMYKK